MGAGLRISHATPRTRASKWPLRKPMESIRGGWACRRSPTRLVLIRTASSGGCSGRRQRVRAWRNSDRGSGSRERRPCQLLGPILQARRRSGTALDSGTGHGCPGRPAATCQAPRDPVGPGRPPDEHLVVASICGGLGVPVHHSESGEERPVDSPVEGAGGLSRAAEAGSVDARVHAPTNGAPGESSRHGRSCAVSTVMHDRRRSPPLSIFQTK